MKEDSGFMERISRDLEARKAACKILDVPENAEEETLKKAYRKASARHHPDHNREEADATKKFLLVKCAYELLAKDIPCPELLEEINAWKGVPPDGKYDLSSSWGHFLWWREKFFD